MAKNRLSDAKIAEMLAVFLEKRTNAKVAKQCGISENTVKRYRKLYKWDDIAEKVTGRVVRRTETKVVNRAIRHAEHGRFLQDASTNTIMRLGLLAGDSAKPYVMPKDAVLAMAKGIEIENEALGVDKDKDVTITLRLPADMAKELIGGQGTG